MRIVVTGGAGFLGSHLCDRLLAEGHEVIAVDNLLTGNPRNIAHLAEEKRFRFLRHDVTHFIFIDGPVDAVLHFASPASPIDYLELPIQTLKVGSLGTHNALGLAMAKKARFLLASTSECYGDPLVHPQPETYWGNVNPIGPRGVYDEAKRFAEAMTMPNPEHVTLLLSSEWNGWRTLNANVTPDLTDANLAGKDLSGKDLRRADLSRADFSAARLDGADFTRATLVGTKWRGTSAAGVILEDCRLDGLDLSRVFFAGARLRSATLQAVNLAEADFAAADLSLTKLEGSDLTGANLAGTNLSDVNFRGVRMWSQRFR